MSRIIIWDWDGTLADSLPHKYESVWKDVFPEREDLERAVISFIHTEEGKRCNRYGLIAHVLIEAGELDKDTDPTKSSLVETYAAKYKKSISKKVPSLRPGVPEALAELKKTFRMYIVSGGGSDQDLEQLLTKLSVKDYFEGIFGYGVSKAKNVSFGKVENFKRIKDLEEEISEVIVIGDTPKDREFAESINARFIGIAHAYNNFVVGDDVVTQVSEIPALLA